MHFFALFTITNRNFVLWRVLTLLISSHPFTLSIYHILDFWCKLHFRIHIIIIQGQMHPLKKKSQKTDHRGGSSTPYGQPGRKIPAFFTASLIGKSSFIKKRFL